MNESGAVQMDTLTQEKTWSYRKDNQSTVEVPESKLKELISSGQLSPDTLVWSSGMTEWVKASSIGSLVPDYDLKPHPWLRFFARQFDLMIYNFFLSLFIVMVSIFLPSLEILYTGISGMFLLQIITVLTWIVPETILMAAFGMTLSKWVFNIKVRNASEAILSLGESFERSLGVAVKGLALGIPVFYLVTMLMSYNKLENTGRTSWDREGNFKVYHGKIGPIRMMAIFGLACIYILFRIITVLTM
ncbi:RDD family protein [Methanocella paludicola]|nr:RDD family protein [Methanocella paludicola]